MTTQKKILDLTGSQYLVQKVKSAIDDVDSSLSTHIADTDIHVTTADKSRWNNQTYVFRYSSTALTPSSTNSNTLLDNTDNLKVGDKVIDSRGVLFSITAIDTANSTFTIGTALIDLAQDSDVVHKSGTETVDGKKTFTDDITASKNTSNGAFNLQNLSYDPKTNGQSAIDSTKSFSINALTSTSDLFGAVSFYGVSDKTIIRFTARYYTDSQNFYNDSLEYTLYGDGTRSFRPRNNNNTTLGESSRKWSGVYATNYYYGSNNVEFSTKFVTTDTNQTISGVKTFSDNLSIYNSDDTVTPKGLAIRNAQWGMGESGGTTVSSIRFLDKNTAIPVSITASKGLSGQSYLRFNVRTKDSQNTLYAEEIYYDIDTSGNVEFRSWHDNSISLGTSVYKWKDLYTNKVNGVEPSSLSLPSGDASNFIDISSYFANTGSGDTNSYTASANGWIFLRLGNISGCVATILDANNNTMWGQSATGGIELLTIPILKGQTLSTRWNTSSTVNVDTARFIPCQGNV